MSLCTFETSQKFPTSVIQIWDFISSPRNLRNITPERMDFEIITKNLPEKMYPGMIIAYRIKPFLGIKKTWVSEITQIKVPEYFVDVQQIGPYKFWHHQHMLKSIPGGVLMVDLVNYKPPFGIIGSVANALFIRKMLKNIFIYRKLKLEKIFGKF